jgi:predicted ribosome quality control (RQC) complex YloA/Tae2 family protein
MHEMIKTPQFIAKIASLIAFKLKEKKLEVCFSQHKDELVLGFAISPTEDFYLIANLITPIAWLKFVANYARANKNSVDLFEPLIGLKVLAVYEHVNERSFDISFENDWQLIFKMHGNNANILLFRAGFLEDIFKSNLENDRNFDFAQLHRVEIMPTSEFDETTLEVSNAYYDQKSNAFYFQSEKDFLLRLIRTNLQKTQTYLTKTLDKQNELTEKHTFEQWANILMANLHLPIQKQNSVELFDFYTDKQIIIKLKSNLSLQKNAELYYRKAKNQHKEHDSIETQIKAKKLLLEKLKAQFEELEVLEDHKSLRNFTKKYGLTSRELDKKSIKMPFRTFIIENFQVLMGRNAINNDLLTLKYTFKEDLWLHAKDVSGSHVVIKYQSGKIFPKSVIQKAAQLAAFHSKRKSEGLVPVICTPKKFVRKPKGLLPGQVITEKETILLVEPSENVA